ncbi:MAG: hypothetical protein LW817_07065, partial [Candidatus Caenarcaniphilales bacterium]|nr:hypothetical protein [Candidatus Caenarcaniphilales bacterium]
MKLQSVKSIMRKFGLVIMAMLMMHSSLTAATTTTTTSNTKKPDRYIPTTFVSGSDSGLQLYINRKSLNLDLTRTKNIRVRVKARELHNSYDGVTSFRINVYEIRNGTRIFVSTQNTTVYKGYSKSRVISLDAGYFVTPSKIIELELADTAGNIINTYRTELTGTNVATQITGAEGVNVGSAACPSGNFNDCQLDYFFQRVTFEARPQKQVTTRVIKGEDGLYKITIPVPRTQFKYLGKRLKNIRGNGSGTSGNGGGGTSGNNGSITVGDIYLGNSVNDSYHISYDGNGGMIFNNDFYFRPSGKFGIGVPNPIGWLHITGGLADTPSIVLNPGTLTTTPINGAIEFDGNRLYFTKNGIRTELGAQGPQGSPGAPGPQGPAGPPGSGGSGGGVGSNGTANHITINNGSVINSRFTFNNGTVFFNNGSVFNVLNGSVFNYFNGTASHYYNGSALYLHNGSRLVFNGGVVQGDVFISGNVTADEYYARLFSGQVFNGGVFRGTFVGNGAGLTNITTNNGTSNNGDIFNYYASNGRINNSIFANGRILNSTINNYYASNGRINNSYFSNGSINRSNIRNVNFYDNNYLNGSILHFINGAMLQDPVLNGRVLFTDNSITRFNGELLLQEGVRPLPVSSFGKIYVNGTTSNLSFLDDTGNNYDLISPFNMTFTPGGSDTWFQFNDGGNLAGNGSLAYNKTTRTLTIPSDANLDINSNSVSIADTVINLDGASSTLNATGPLSLNSGVGQDLTMNISGSGVFKVNTNLIYANNSNSSVAIGDSSPEALLDIGGGTANFIDGLNDLLVRDDLEVDGTVFASKFNGGTFYGDGSNLTGVAANNGTINNITINNSRINNSSFYNNNYFNGTTIHFVNGAMLQDPVLNGRVLFTDNSITRFNGELLIQEGSTPAATSGFGKLFVNSTTSNLSFLDDAGASFDLLNALSGGSTPGGNNTWFQFNDSGLLAGNGALSFTKGSKTLTVASDAAFDINSNNVSIADTSIVLDGASTTFTQTTGNIILDPNNYVGINTPTPIATLDIGGGIVNFIDGTDDVIIKDDLEVDGTIFANKFNGGTFTGTFIGDGSGLTGIAASNGTVNNLTINNGTINNSYFTNGTINRTNISNSSFYGNNYFNGTTMYFVNGAMLQDPVLNGRVLFTDNSITRFNGEVLFQNSTRPSSIAGFGKLYVNGTTSNLMYLDSTGTQFDILAAGGGSGGDANTLDTLDSLQFLRSDTSDQFTSGTLRTEIGTLLQINGDLAIHDTNINLIGGGATFTGDDSITMNPLAGTSFSVNISGAGNFNVGPSMFLVDNALGRVGIFDPSPQATLDVAGGIPNFIDGTNDAIIADDLEVDGTVFANQFNGGTFYGTFVGSGVGLTGVASSNGSVNNFTINNGNIFDVYYSNGVINRTNISNSSFYNNNYLNGTHLYFVNGAMLQDPVLNGRVLFTDNSITRFNGQVLYQYGSRPAGETGFGKLYVNGTTANLMFLDEGGTQFDLMGGGSGGGGAPGGSNTWFQFNDAGTLAGNGALSFTKASKTLSVAGDAILDINSSNVSIADTNITLDGANTTFTATGFIGLTPGAGNNLNVNLSGAGDFAVNSNQLYVDTSLARVGIGDLSPSSLLDVGSGAPNFIDGTNDAIIADDLEVDGTIFANKFNGGTFTGTFVGDGTGLTGVAANNGSVNNLTINNGVVNNVNIFNSNFINGDIFNGNILNSYYSNGVVNRTIIRNSSFYSNNYFNGARMYFVNGAMLQDPVLNGRVLFTDNSITRFNGELMLQHNSRPGNTSGFGKLYVNGATANLMFLDASGNQFDLQTSGTADTLDGIDSSEFLRSNTSDQFTSGTLTTAAGTTFRVNGNLAIADTVVDFTGASTTLNGSIGAISVRPASGTNFNVSLATTGDFAVNTNQLYVDTSATNVGIGTTTPTEKLEVAGTMQTTGFKLTTGAGNNYILTSDAVGLASWTNPSSISLGDANTLDTIDSLQFLRSDTSDQFTSGTLTTATGTTFRVNGDIAIADINISLTGASTTFTQNTGAISFSPASGNNLNINLAAAGDFAVNTNQLYVDTATSNTGIGFTAPNAKLTVNGDMSFREITALTAPAGFGKVFVNTIDSELYFDADDQTAVKITNNGMLAAADA